MSIQSMLLRKMLSSQMKGVPQSDQDRIFNILEKNPEIFQKIALEAKVEMKNGSDQMSAIMSVAKRHESELKKLTE